MVYFDFGISWLEVTANWTYTQIHQVKRGMSQLFLWYHPPGGGRTLWMTRDLDTSSILQVKHHSWWYDQFSHVFTHMFSCLSWKTCCNKYICVTNQALQGTAQNWFPTNQKCGPPWSTRQWWLSSSCWPRQWCLEKVRLSWLRLTTGRLLITKSHL